MHRTVRSVRRSGDPLRIELLGVGFGFLLIVRTERIVTLYESTQVSCSQRSTVGYSDVPAYSQVL